MSETRSDTRWPGCHGVRLRGAAVSVGTAAGTPLAEATVHLGPVREPDGTRLWVQHGETVVDGERRTVDRVLVRRPDGRLVLSGGDGPVVEVDQPTATVTIDSRDEIVHRQLVAAFALPLILHDANVLVVHGAACALGDEAVLVCGESGAGKSSTLVRLVDAGWLAVSEDACAIDLDAAGGPVVWPGPPWVRVARGKPGPRGAALLFDQLQKTAWDLSGVQAEGPKRLSRIVLLEPPGGTVATLRPVLPAEAIPALATHAVWLQEQDQKAPRLFPLVSALASRVPVFRVQLPRDEHWAENLPAVLAS